MITLEDLPALQAQGCRGPGCDHVKHAQLYLRAACHLSAGIMAHVDFQHQSVVIQCAKCGREAAEIAIGKREG